MCYSGNCIREYPSGSCMGAKRGFKLPCELPTCVICGSEYQPEDEELECAECRAADQEEGL